MRKRLPGRTKTLAVAQIQAPTPRNVGDGPEPRKFDSPLDKGIAYYVNALMDFDVETFESCEGGAGHSYPEPTVRFHGNRAEGMRALAAAQTRQLPIRSLSRIWPIIDDEPTGPYWEMVFYKRGDCR